MRIGLFLIDATSLFQGHQKNAAESAARGSGVELDVFFAAGDGKKQRDQLFAYMRGESAPAAIVVEPVEDAGLRYVAQEALRGRVAWVMINCRPGWVAELGGEHGGLGFCVTADQRGIGRLQGEQFRALLPEGGTVLYITGPSLADAPQERLAGMEETKGEHISAIRVVGAWTEASGHDAVRTWLDTTRGFVSFDLIGAQNDDMAVGAKRAVHEAGQALGTSKWDAIPVTGVDGTPEYGQRLVDEGTLAGTVIMPTTTGKAVEQLVAALRKGARPPAITTVPVTSYPQMALLKGRR